MQIQGTEVDLRALVANKEQGIDFLIDNIVGTLMESVDDKPPILTPEDFNFTELREAVDVTAFPIVTGQIISKKIRAAYELAAMVGDQLVTRMPSKKLYDRVPRLNLTGNLKKVNAGMPYDHSADIEEEWTAVEGSKYGEILDVTEEAVLFDQTNSILQVAGQMGADAAMYREQMIMNTIQDLTGYKAWRPSGTQVDLYQNATTAPHTYDNLINNVLADHTDINAAVLLWPTMLNSRGRPISIVPKVLLVPVALKMMAKTIMTSTVQLGTYNQTPNPVQNDYMIISSPYLDLQSAIIWYLGDFKKQFVWKEVIPLQVLRRGKDSEEGWSRDILASYKIRFFGAPAAIDYMYVVKSIGTT